MKGVDNTKYGGEIKASDFSVNGKTLVKEAKDIEICRKFNEKCAENIRMREEGYYWKEIPYGDC